MPHRDSIFIGTPRQIGDFVLGLPALDILGEAVPDAGWVVGAAGNMRNLVADRIAMDEAFALPPKMPVPMPARPPWDVIRWRRKAGRPFVGFRPGWRPFSPK